MAKKPQSEIIRHTEPSKNAGTAPPRCLTEKQMKAVEDHVSKHVGNFKMVLHEVISEGIHLDVIPVEPIKSRPFKTFVTMGTSAVPMAVPPGYEGPDRIELAVVLPPEWPTDAESFKAPGELHYWPIRWLKNLGRLPSDFDTYLGVGHTVPNGEPPEPLGKGCKFVCWMLVPPLSFKPGFSMLKSRGFSVEFLQIIPLYLEEMELKLNEGVEVLWDRFADAAIDPTLLCDPERPNVAKRGKTIRRRPSGAPDGATAPPTAPIRARPPS